MDKKYSTNPDFGSRDFSEQIAQLELEGNKIMDATLTLGGVLQINM